MKILRRDLIKGILALPFLVPWRSNAKTLFTGGLNIVPRELDIVSLDANIDSENGYSRILVGGNGEIGPEVAYSDDYGETWYLVDGPPSESVLTCVAIIEHSYWMIGMENGDLWETRDGGKSWKNVEYRVIEDNSAVTWAGEL